MTSQIASESALFQNPFLDPYAPQYGGTVAPVGTSLTRLHIPPVESLVYKTQQNGSSFSMISVPLGLSKIGSTIEQPVVVRNEAVGIELSLTTIGSLGQPPPIIPSGTAPVQSVSQPIPINMREAKEVISMITPQRTGSKSRVFGINELKQIARNLNLPSTGNKDVLASRIRTAVIEYFNLPSQ